MKFIFISLLLFSCSKPELKGKNDKIEAAKIEIDPKKAEEPNKTIVPKKSPEVAMQTSSDTTTDVKATKTSSDTTLDVKPTQTSSDTTEVKTNTSVSPVSTISTTSTTSTEQDPCLKAKSNAWFCTSTGFVTTAAKELGYVTVDGVQCDQYKRKIGSVDSWGETASIECYQKKLIYAKDKNFCLSNDKPLYVADPNSVIVDPYLGIKAPIETISIANCVEQDPGMQWFFRDFLIYNAEDRKCIDIRNGEVIVGNHVTTFDCRSELKGRKDSQTFDHSDFINYLTYNTGDKKTAFIPNYGQFIFQRSYNINQESKVLTTWLNNANSNNYSGFCFSVVGKTPQDKASFAHFSTIRLMKCDNTDYQKFNILPLQTNVAAW